MTNLNYLLLAVENPARSAEFYTALLGQQPVENSPTFVLYVLPNGLKLGLWLKDDMIPAPKSPGGVEITFSEPDIAAVNRTHDAWKAQGVEIIQSPTTMDFGFTFTARDPDGHHLRVFARAENPR